MVKLGKIKNNLLRQKLKSGPFGLQHSAPINLPLKETKISEHIFILYRFTFQVLLFLVFYAKCVPYECITEIMQHRAMLHIVTT
jgi:hypothetical protein